MITVLWIDDQYKDQIAFIDLARLKYDIEIKPFDLRVNGMEELEKNIRNYDAVILDAKMLDESRDEKPDTKGLFISISKLNELKGKSQHIPFVIFTAQPDVLSDHHFNNSTIGIDKYKKGIENDMMLKDILEKVKDLPIAKIRINYSRAFQLCTRDYIGEEASSKLIQLLLILENKSNAYNMSDMLIAVRKIIEKIFDKFVAIAVLPKEVAMGEGSLTKSSIFLAGKHNGYKYKESILDPVVAFQIKNILEITQDSAHTRDGLRLDVDSYIHRQGNHYLFYSTIYQLLDVMNWCKSYFDNNPDIEKNKKITEPISSESLANLVGKIEKDENGNYFCGAHLLNQHKLDETFRVGDEIMITNSIENSDRRLSSTYPKFANRFEKLTK